ncbi:hypothetical protein BSKO_07308 [Bryopsis sp. KO-2023]|nr:hypothetical protein BSKO_07308 [Bryopsis sp. KO-2023]
MKGLRRKLNPLSVAFEVFVRLAFSILLFFGLGEGMAAFFPDDQLVSNCEALGAAVKDLQRSTIVIDGHILCEDDTLFDPLVMTNRSLKIEGHHERSSSIAFEGGAPQPAVVLRKGAMVSFEKITIYGGPPPQISDLKLGFVEAGDDAALSFKNVKVVFSSCDQGADARETPTLAAWGVTCHDGGSYYVQDVVISRPFHQLLRIEETYFLCRDGQTSAIESRLEQIENSCHGGSEGGVGSGIDSCIHLIGVVAVVALFLTSMVGAFLWRQRRLDIARKTTLARTPSFELKPYAPIKVDWLSVQLEDIELGPVVGRGSFSTVHLGGYEGIQIAVKILDHEISALEPEPFEARLARKVSHPNIVRTLVSITRELGSCRADPASDLIGGSGDIETDVFSSESLASDDFDDIENKAMNQTNCTLFRTWIVMEYCDRGCLSAALRRKCFFDGDSRKLYIVLTAIEIASAIKHLHDNGIVHGDVKPENVLLRTCAADPRGFVCKLADFGFSRQLNETDHVLTFTCGSVRAMPPELLKDGLLSTATDVYSFGMLLWEILACRPPYAGRTSQSIMVDVVEGLRPEIPAKWPAAVRELIRDCLKQDHEQRPNFSDILARLRVLEASCSR